MSICILADAADIDHAKQIELEYMSVDDLKKYGYDIAWFSPQLIRNIGWTRTSSLSRNLLKNTTLSLHPRPLSSKFLVSLVQASPKVNVVSILLLPLSNSFIFSWQVPYSGFQQWRPQQQNHWSSFHHLKKVPCLGVAVGHFQMTDDQVLGNVMLSTSYTLFHCRVFLEQP